MATTQFPSTPQEFVEYYSQQLEDYLQVHNIQISKTGFIGFLLSLLGWTNYDIKQYYDSLFKEMFVATAQQDSSLLLHGSLYGYIPLFATPAVATGNIEIDWTLLPVGNLDKSLNFNYQHFSEPSIQGSYYLTFFIDDLPFTTYTQYTIKEVSTGTGSQKLVEIKDETGTTKILPLSSGFTINVPLVDFKQYYVKLDQRILSNYPLYHYDSITINLDDDEFIYDIIVNVKESGATQYEPYTVKSVKYFSQADDKHVFLRQISNNKYVLEFGNGVHGRWIPSAQIAIVLKITKGAGGNSILNKTTKQLILNQVTYTHSIDTGNPVIVNLDFSNIGTINVDYTDHGVDPLSGDELRYAIVKYIQTRDVLISETDFINVASKYFNDFKFLFKKSKLQEHTFYLLRTFRDRYQKIIKTTQVNQLVADFGSSQYEPVFTVNGVDYISPFSYKYNTDLNLYEAVVVYDDYTFYFSEQQVLIQQSDNPVSLYLNIVYDNVQDKTRIYFKSYQDISGHIVKFTASRLGYFDYVMTEDVGNNQYYIEFDGFIADKFDVVIKYYDNTGTQLLMQFKATDVQYVYSMEGLVDLVVYQNNVVNIPVLEKSVYDVNGVDSRQYYKNKIINFALENNFSENRAICDNIQFRFLNTIQIENPYMMRVTKQGSHIAYFYDHITDLITEPPLTPVEGGIYFILPGAKGEFSGHDNDIAEYIDGEFIFHRPATTTYPPANAILNDPPDTSTLDVGTRYIIGTNPTGDWSGHANEIAVWQGDHWDFIIAQQPAVCFVIEDGQYYRFSHLWNGTSFVDSWSSAFTLKLPLHLYCYLIYDKIALETNPIDVNNDIESLELELAELLTKKYSGTNIKFYSSQLVDYIHQTRPYVKKVAINVFDDNNLPMLLGIESVEYDTQFFNNLSKWQIATFTPPYWYWDIDNIKIKYIID